MTEIIIDGKVKSSCKLKINPAEIVAVKTMFDKFLELQSLSGVSKYLIKHNIKSRSGKLYSLLGIKEILQNPVYCIADADALDYFTQQNADVCFTENDCSDTLGLLSYNKRDYKKKHAPRQPIEKWIIAIGRHKGIVSGKKWVAVQNILEANKPNGKKPAKMHNEYSLLSGLIFCEKCGSRMFAKSRSNNSELFDYLCNSKMRGGMELCDSQNLGGQQADDIVCEYLMDYMNGTFDIYQLLETLKKDLAAESQEKPIETVDASLNKLNAEMDKFIQSLSQANLNTAFVNRVSIKVEELDAQIKILSERRSQLEQAQEQVSEKELQLDVIAQALSSLKGYFNELSIHEKRALIKLLVKKIIWDGRDLHIFLDGE